MAEQTMQIDVTAEDVWLLPGWQNSDADHWQSRWEQRHGYRRLEQNDWDRPLRGDWSARLQETVLDAPRPVVLVAHSLGDRKSTRLNSSHLVISYAVFCLKKKKKKSDHQLRTRTCCRAWLL